VFLSFPSEKGRRVSGPGTLAQNFESVVNNGSAMHPHGAPGPGEHMRMDKKHTGKEFAGVWVKVGLLGPQLQKWHFALTVQHYLKMGIVIHFQKGFDVTDLNRATKKKRNQFLKNIETFCVFLARRRGAQSSEPRMPCSKTLSSRLTLAV